MTQATSNLLGVHCISAFLIAYFVLIKCDNARVNNFPFHAYFENHKIQVILSKKGLSKHQVGVLKDTSIDNKFMMMLLLIFY